MRRRRSRKGMEFELNIVPILDCLTILVAFMLASGTYISIASLEVQVSAGGESAAETEKESVDVTVRMISDGGYRVEVSGNAKKNVSVGPEKGTWNREKLNQTLSEIRDAWPKVKQVTLISAAGIKYQDVVSALETMRKTHPEVSLGGF